MDNKDGLLPIADLIEIQRGKTRMKMFGFLRQKRPELPAPEPPAEVVRETDHDGANVSDAILASNAS